jgi:hypothetical protein
LLLRVEREKGNNDIIQDKIKIIDEKIRELESDFKSLLIKRSN